MKDSAKYAKIVEWSVEDQCYIGSAPGLILGGCHGEDETEVFKELCEFWQAIKFPLRPPGLNDDVITHDITEVS